MAVWRPLVTSPEQRARIVAAIRELAVTTEPGPRSAIDDAHDAITRAYLAEEDVIEDPEDLAGAALASAVTRFAAGTASPGLFDGAAGVGLCVEHLARGDTADAVCTAVDAALWRRLEGAWDGPYDLISGLAGIGMYALERGDAGHRVAGRVLDHLDELACPHGGGLAWRTPGREGAWNLGMAHGVPGVIALLARAVAGGVDVTRSRRLLDGAIAFLLEVVPPSPTGRYPAWAPAPASETQRLAWCYGDLGVSIALLAAATACDDDRWRTEALDLARRCAATSFDEAQVVDAGLCHGASGAAHLFNRLHQATGDAAFAIAARRWLDHALAQCAGQPITDRSLLTGSAGIALVLHAMISSVEPSWDRLLAVDEVLRSSATRECRPADRS